MRKTHWHYCCLPPNMMIQSNRKYTKWTKRFVVLCYACFKSNITISCHCTKIINMLYYRNLKWCLKAFVFGNALMQYYVICTLPCFFLFKMRVPISASWEAYRISLKMLLYEIDAKDSKTWQYQNDDEIFQALQKNWIHENASCFTP